MKTETQNRTLNENGVKSSYNMWRTIDGVQWNHWSTVMGAGQVLALRAHGVRCRRFGEEIFVHPGDELLAAVAQEAFEVATGAAQ